MNTLNSPKIQLLSVAIDRYNDSMFDELYNAVSDSDELVNVLEQKYLITKSHKIHNHNATKSNIFDKINEWKKELGFDDTFILFWNGHGESHDDRGFLITNESKKDNPSSWFPYSELLRLLKGIKAKHIVLMINSCHAGEILKERERGSNSLSISDNSKESRWVFVSGSGKVSDGIKGENSPFAKAIIEFLGTNNTNSSVSIREVTKYVKDFIRDDAYKQDPFDTVFDPQNDKGGVFHFQLKETDEDIWNRIKAKPSINDLEDFISKYQGSKLTIFAEEKLKELQDSRDKWSERLEKFDSDLDYFIKQYENGEYVTVAKEYKQRIENDITNINKYKTETEEWENARRSDDLAIINNFIDKYKDIGRSETLQKAKNIKENLQKKLRIKSAWDELERKLKGTLAERRVSDYHYFIRKHKVTGIYYQKASDKIDEIEFYIKALKEAVEKYDITLLKEYLEKANPSFKRAANTKIKEIENSKSKEGDSEELEKIIITKSIQDLKSFIQEPQKRNNEVIVDAKGRLEELEKDIQENFEIVMNTNKPKELYSFYTTYYDCKEVDIVKRTFFKVEEEIFLKSKHDKDISALEDYITTFQDLDNTYISDAIGLIKELKKDNEAYSFAEEKDEIVYYDKYLNSFLNGKYREKALDRKDVLIKKNEALNLYNECKKDVLRKDLEKYKNLYFHTGDNIDDVELMLKELDEKEDEETLYGVVISDNGRIVDCEIYIDKCKNEYNKEYRSEEVTTRMNDLIYKQTDETAKENTLSILEKIKDETDRIKAIKENYLDVVGNGEHRNKFITEIEKLELQKEERITYNEAINKANEKESYDDKIEVWEMVYSAKYENQTKAELIHLEDVRTIIKDLKRDKSAFDFFNQMDKLGQETNNDNEAIGYYDEYLKEYPNGLNTQKAENSIVFHQNNKKAQTLYDDIINEKAQNAFDKVISHCRDYKINYSNKKHIQEIKEIQEKAILRQEEDRIFDKIKSSPTQENCENYILNKQYKQYRKEVIRFLNNIENGEEIINKTEVGNDNKELVDSMQTLAETIKGISVKQGRTEEVLNKALKNGIGIIIIVIISVIVIGYFLSKY
jgi:hypothetical protein